MALVTQVQSYAPFVEMRRMGRSASVDRIGHLEVPTLFLRDYGSHPDVYARHVNEITLGSVDAKVEQDEDTPTSMQADTIAKSPDIIGMPPIYGLRPDCKLFVKHVDRKRLTYRPWDNQRITPSAPAEYVLGSYAASCYVGISTKDFMTLVRSRKIGEYRGSNTDFARTGARLTFSGRTMQGFLVTELNRHRK